MLNRSHNHIPLPTRFENNLEQNLQSVIQNSEKFMKFTRVELDANGEKKKRGAKRKNDQTSWVVETSNDEQYNENYNIEEENVKEEGNVIEEIEYIEEIDDICRLCATQTQTNERVHIFNEYGELTEEAESISIMPKDTIQFNDGLPQNACLNCLEKLESCVSIINGFVNNQSLFLN